MSDENGSKKLYTWDVIENNGSLLERVSKIYGVDDINEEEGGNKSSSSYSAVRSFMPFEIRQLLGDFMCAYENPEQDLFQKLATDQPDVSKKAALDEFKKMAKHLASVVSKGNPKKQIVAEWYKRVVKTPFDAYVDVAQRFSNEKDLLSAIVIESIHEQRQELETPEDPQQQQQVPDQESVVSSPVAPPIEYIDNNAVSVSSPPRAKAPIVSVVTTMDTMAEDQEEYEYMAPVAKPPNVFSSIEDERRPLLYSNPIGNKVSDSDPISYRSPLRASVNISEGLCIDGTRQVKVNSNGEKFVAPAPTPIGGPLASFMKAHNKLEKSLLPSRANQLYTSSVVGKPKRPLMSLSRPEEEEFEKPRNKPDYSWDHAEDGDEEEKANYEVRMLSTARIHTEDEDMKNWAVPLVAVESPNKRRRGDKDNTEDDDLQQLSLTNLFASTTRRPFAIVETKS